MRERAERGQVSSKREKGAHEMINYNFKKESILKKKKT